MLELIDVAHSLLDLLVIEGRNVAFWWMFQLVSNRPQLVLHFCYLLLDDGGIDRIAVYVKQSLLRSKVCIFWMSYSL